MLKIFSGQFFERRFLLIMPVLVILPALHGCSQSASGGNTKNSKPKHDGVKVNGLSFVASPKTVTEKEVSDVGSVYANWVSLMPFAFVRDNDSPFVRYNNNRQWRGERIDGIKETTKLFKSKGISVMLKPQLWLGHGSFTGHFELKTEESWKIFEQGYENYILDFAVAAEEVQCDMFCIGTELGCFVKARPVFWDSLIQKIKKVYHGKLTYAENWDVFDKVPFWNKLDFIGIDAYFPLSNNETFSVSDIENGWVRHKQLIESIAEKNGKSILFTEYGYRSSMYAAKEPWTELSSTVNLQNQETALQGLYKTFWKESWFAGGFLWKWYDNATAGGENNSDYTPQNKPALKVIVQQFQMK